MIMILAYNALILKQRPTYIALIISCVIVLVVYVFAGIWQYLHITGTSFTELYDISGINGHKNLLSAMLFLLSSFLLTVIPFLKNRIAKTIPIAIYVLSLIFVVILKSRATLLGFIVSIVFFVMIVILHKKNIVLKRKSKLIISAIAVVITFVFLTVILRKASNSIIEKSSEGSQTEYNILSASSMYERLALWDNTYKLSDQRPILGCGLGNWKIDMPSVGTLNLYRSDVWNINFVRPHNEFLGILSECGYITLVIYLIYLCSIVVFSLFAICELKDKRDFILGAVSLSIFVGANIISMFDFPNERIEFVIWINIIIGILFVMLTRNKSTKGFNYLFLILSVLFTIMGFYRYIGEYYTYDMQQAIKTRDFNSTIKYSQKSISPFFNIDPIGNPIQWYKGHALLMKGDTRAKYSLRKAYKDAPYCKQNLNDLGFVTYYEDHDLELAEYYLRQSMKISPNYFYSGFNLTTIFIHEKEYNRARMVLDLMYTDEEKRDMLLRDAQFYAPDNLEYETSRIKYDYDTRMHLQQYVDSLRLQIVE